MKQSSKTGVTCSEEKRHAEAFPADRFTAISWKGVEPLYVWSGLIGLAVALLLVGIALMMEHRHY